MRFIKHYENLIPELYPAVHENSDVRTREDKPFQKHNIRLIKPGRDYYLSSFATLLTIFLYIFLFYSDITGRTGDSLSTALEKQHFSTNLVLFLLLLIIIMCFERVLYSMKTTIKPAKDRIFKGVEQEGTVIGGAAGGTTELESERLLDEEDEQRAITQSLKEKFAEIYQKDQDLLTAEEAEGLEREKEVLTNRNLAILKLCVHYGLVLLVHILLFFVVPKDSNRAFYENTSLIILYLLCCLYFTLNSLQIKYGYPYITKRSSLTKPTLANRLGFKVRL